MVAKHGDHRDVDGRGQLARQDARLLGQPVVGEVTAQQQDVGGVTDLGEQRVKRALRVLDTWMSPMAAIRRWRRAKVVRSGISTRGV